jgi:hypothetical protein
MYVFYVGISLDIENSVFYHFRTRMFPGNLWPAVENDVKYWQWSEVDINVTKYKYMQCIIYSS